MVHIRGIHFCMLLGLTLSIEMDKAQDRGPENPGPTLAVEIVNSRPILGEPLKVRVTATNNTGGTLKLPITLDNGSLGFMIFKDGKLIADVDAAGWEGRRIVQDRELQDKESVSTHEMLTVRPSATIPLMAEPGEYELRVTLRGGNERRVKLVLAKPEGIDEEAFKYLCSEKLLGYMTLYYGKAPDPKHIGALQAFLGRFPGCRYEPYVRYMLACNQIDSAGDKLRVNAGANPEFTAVEQLCTQVAYTQGFPFASEVRTYLGLLYFRVGCGKTAKELLTRSFADGGIPQRMLADVQAKLKRLESSPESFDWSR